MEAWDLFARPVPDTSKTPEHWYRRFFALLAQTTVSMHQAMPGPDDPEYVCVRGYENAMPRVLRAAGCRLRPEFTAAERAEGERKLMDMLWTLRTRSRAWLEALSLFANRVKCSGAAREEYANAIAYFTKIT